MTAVRRLALLRHAVAEPSAPRDHDRALALPGPGQARAAAHWLAEHDFVPDHVVVSDARRTLETARAALGEWEGEPTFAPLIDSNPAVYEAGCDSLLDLIRSVPADTGRLLVVGHNPTIAQLVQLLDDGSREPGDSGLTGGFPPASVALFDIDREWQRLQFFGAVLIGARTGGQEA